MKIDWKRLLAVVLAAIPGFLAGLVVPGLLVSTFSHTRHADSLVSVAAAGILTACLSVFAICHVKKLNTGVWLDFAMTGVVVGNIFVIAVCSLIPLVKRIL